MNSFSPEQLEQLKDQLKVLQQELIQFLHLDEATAETVELDQGKVGRLSRMNALQQQAMAQASGTAHKQQLLKVQRALHHIEQGDYGYCEACGQLIAFARLQAQPESEYCITCLQALEENQ